MMRNILHLNLALTVLLWLLARVSGLQETWHSCSTNSCNTALSAYPCSLSSGHCQCGAPSVTPSTCALQPSLLATQIAAPLDTSIGALTCCLCQSNVTFCCQTCDDSSTSTSIPLTTSTVAATRSGDYARIIAAFVLDCPSYNTTQVAQQFPQALASTTSITSSYVDVEQSRCVSGNQPYCGVDVGIIGADHHRARRFVGGRGAKGGSSKKKSSEASYSYNSAKYIPYVEEEMPCKSLFINAKIWQNPSSGKTLLSILETLQESVVNGTFGVKLTDNSIIKATFLISAMRNTTLEIHLGPYMYYPGSRGSKRTRRENKEPVTTTKPVPPLETNLKPLIYAGGAVLGLIFLCVIYQLLKQTYLLRKRKFTNINSDRVNMHKKRAQEVMNNQAEAEGEARGEFEMTFTSLPPVDNNALTRRYDWTTPGYVPNMLAPAYSPTEFHGQRSPPRLILDDDDGEKNSLGKASVINIDDESDDDLRDILESDDEYDRPSSKKSSRSIRQPPSGTGNSRKPSRITRESSTASTGKRRKESATISNPRQIYGHDNKTRKPSTVSRSTRESSTASNKKLRQESATINNPRQIYGHDNNTRKLSTVSRITRESSTASNAKRRQDASTEKSSIVASQQYPGKTRKCSYMGPEEREISIRESKSPTPSFGLLKTNRITPLCGDRKASVSSLKPQKITAQSEC